MIFVGILFKIVWWLQLILSMILFLSMLSYCQWFDAIDACFDAIKCIDSIKGIVECIESINFIELDIYLMRDDEKNNYYEIVGNLDSHSGLEMVQVKMSHSY